MKRVLFTILSSVFCIATAFSQSEMFEWQIYSAFDNPKMVVEAKECVYILAEGYLYSYDKEYAEVAEINRNNKLSDTEISLIKYDNVKDMLVVAYANGNIDILYKNKTYNIPYIKEAIMTTSKTINNINFLPEKDEIYLSTDFGIVILNSKKIEIKNSFELGIKVLDATYFEDKYYIIDDEAYLSCCSEENIPYDINNWESIYKFSTKPQTLLNLSDTLWIQTSDKILGYNKNIGIKNIAYGKYSSLEQNALNEIYAYSKTNSYIDVFFSDFSKKNKIEILPQIGYTPINISCNNKNSLYWFLNENGIASYKTEEINITRSDTIPMVDKLAVSTPYSLAISGSTLYCVPVGICLDNENQQLAYNNISYLKDYRWHNIYGDNVPSPKDKPSYITKFMLPSKLAIHPDNDEVAYVGTWFDGLYKFEKGKYKENWNYMNSPIVGAADNSGQRYWQAHILIRVRSLWKVGSRFG